MVDCGNDCVRKVHRISGRAEDFAGECGNGGFFNGTRPATEALLNWPEQAIFIAEQRIMYYLLSDAIVHHNLLTGMYLRNKNSFFHESLT